MRTPPLRSIVRVVVLLWLFPRTTPSAAVILVDIPSPLITKLLSFIDGFVVELLQLLLEESSHVA
jgi:hypothetical protein